MNPAIWLAIWIVAAVLAATVTGIMGYLAGYDKGHLEATEHERGRHRQGVTPELPRPGRLEVLADPDAGPFGPHEADWRWFGGAQVEPQPGAAEYALLTQTASNPFADPERAERARRCDPGESWPPPPGPEGDRILAEHDPGHPDLHPDDESPSDFTRRHAAEVEAMIAGWEAEGNYFRHIIQAGDR
jgi:hypothetical protein